MKAARIHEHGDLDRIRVEEAPEPRAAAGEAVIEVRAAALNHLDIWVRKGGRAKIPLPHILGSDAAGVVAAVGDGVDGAKVGDEVILNPGITTGRSEFARRGQQSECPTFSLVGLARPGTFAQRVAVPASNLYPKPAHLSWQEAAALPLAYVTAFRMLTARANLRPGETVLIHGIGGGVALAGLQFAKAMGARVLVTSSSDEKLERATRLGADGTVNYRAVDDLSQAILDWTGARGVDVVLDAVGAATWPVNLEVARKGGRIVHCAVTTGSDCPANIQAIYWKQLSILGSTMGSDEDFRLLVETVRATGLRPVIDRVYPLDAAREAAACMEAGEQFGKLVLEVE